MKRKPSCSSKFCRVSPVYLGPLLLDYTGLLYEAHLSKQHELLSATVLERLGGRRENVGLIMKAEV